MNGRVVLVGLAVAVLGTALYFLVIRGGGDGEPGDGGRAAAGDPNRPERDIPSEPPQGAGAADPGPGRVIPPDPELDTNRAPVEHVREDGSTVRDHRKNPNEYIRPSLPHPDLSPVTPSVTSSVMALVRPVVLTCMKDVPEAAYGARPVVMTRATISIDDDGMLTVVEIGPALDDIDEAAAAAALDCIREKSGTLSTRVDNAAVASTNLAFPIRPLDYRRDKPPSK